jgi:hypothetical protein
LLFAAGDLYIQQYVLVKTLAGIREKLNAMASTGCFAFPKLGIEILFSNSVE